MNTTNTIKDEFEIANKFNNYFVNIGPNLAKKITNTSNTNFSEYLTHNYLNSMYLDLLTEFEVQNEMNNFNSNKSPGYNGLSARTIKQVSNEVSKPIAHIFNWHLLQILLLNRLKLPW